MSVVICDRCPRWIDLDWETPIELEIDKEIVFIHECCATDSELEEEMKC